ncbi:MAG: hypothetical protein K6E83_10380 [Clostridium sp.]|nr:hypothetical protein [Clostridium sp.]
MSGRTIKNRKTGRGTSLIVPLALQIFLVLTLMTVLMGNAVYRMQLKGFQDYELKNYQDMMEMCVRTGVNQIRLEKSVALRNGKPLDLESLHDRIAGVEFDPAQFEGNPVPDRKWDTPGYSLRNASLYFQLLVLRGDGKTLLIDGYSGLMKELDKGDVLGEYGWQSYKKDMLVKGTVAGSEDDGEEDPDGSEPEAYALISVIPAETIITYGEHTLLFNHAGAGVGMACRADTSALREHCRSRALKNSMITFGISWLAVILMCLYVHRSMRPLRAMQYFMRRFRLEGDEVLKEKNWAQFLPDRTKPREEMTDLSESFYVMANSLRQYHDSVESIRERYEAFVPAVLDALFDTEDVLKIEPGNETRVSGSSLEVLFIYDSAAEKVQKARVAVIAAEMAEGKGGLITALDESGLTALFPGGTRPDEAVELIRSLPAKEIGLKDIRWKTDTGDFCVRLIGSQERMAFLLEKL